MLPRLCRAVASEGVAAHNAVDLPARLRVEIPARAHDQPQHGAHVARKEREVHAPKVHDIHVLIDSAPGGGREALFLELESLHGLRAKTA